MVRKESSEEKFFHAHANATDGDPGAEAFADSSALPENSQETGLVAINESGHHVAEIGTRAHKQQKHSQHCLNTYDKK